MVYWYRGDLGSYGSFDGQFTNPAGIAVGVNGDLYVVDSGSLSRVQRFSKNGQFLGKFGGHPLPDDVRLRNPIGIAIDSNFDVYVTDVQNHNIQKFDRDGVFIRKWGTFGSGNGQFNFPEGIVADSDNDIFVVDLGNNRIQKFTSDGQFIKTWGGGGLGDGQLQSPNDVALDSNNNIYITQGSRQHPQFDNEWRITKFDPNGNFIKKWGRVGGAFGEFPSRPIGISIFGNTVVVVTPVTIDNRLYNVHEFSTDGVFIASFGPFGTDAPVQGQLYNAHFIATTRTSEGVIYYITCPRRHAGNQVKRFSSFLGEPVWSPNEELLLGRPAWSPPVWSPDEENFMHSKI